MKQKSLMFLLAFNFYNFVMTLDCVIKSAIKKNNLTEVFSSVLGFSLVKSLLQQEKLMPFDLVVFYREYSFCKYCWLSLKIFQILASILLVGNASSCSSDHFVS